MAKVRKMFHRKERGLHITQLMARDGSDCTICSKPLDRHIKNFRHPEYITFEHKHPRSLGGSDELKNLRLAHLSCNRARGIDPILPGDEEYDWLYA